MAAKRGSKLRKRIALVAGIAAIWVSAAAEVPSEDELRVTESSYFSEAGRKQAVPDRITTDSMNPRQKSGKRSADPAASQPRKSTNDTLKAPNTDFWFYAADVELFADVDGDGYYYGIDLLFDADTYFEYADVYAVVYLSLEGGPWTEYAETDVFPIRGASGDDEYVIVTELLAGYPSGGYDMLIELFDAWDDSFVADIGPADSSELANLPLEDSDRDAPVIVTQSFVVSQGGGGALDWPSIAIFGFLALCLSALRRRYQPPSASPGLTRSRGPFA